MKPFAALRWDLPCLRFESLRAGQPNTGLGDAAVLWMSAGGAAGLTIVSSDIEN